MPKNVFIHCFFIHIFIYSIKIDNKETAEEKGRMTEEHLSLFPDTLFCLGLFFNLLLALISFFFFNFSSIS